MADKDNLAHGTAIMNGAYPENPEAPVGSSFVDDRGEILNVLLVPCSGVARIRSKKGTVRANHYHATDWHYTYVEKGEVLYFERAMGSQDVPEPRRFGPGKMFYTPPMREHAMLFAEDAVIFTFARLARTHDSHEADVGRVSFVTPEIARRYVPMDGYIRTLSIEGESYVNRRYENHECSRWWAHPWILVGGSINDEADWRHLLNDFKVDAVISVESEHTDEGIVPAEASAYLPFADVGVDPGPEHWMKIAEAGRAAFMQNGPSSRIYVHCQMGGSRSPAAAYIIMRYALAMSHEGAMKAIRRTRPQYGDHAFHQVYINGARRALGDAL